MVNVPVNFKYKFDDNYNPLYINGAYGGINPRGEIIANFYFERNPLPYEEKRHIDEAGEFVGEIETNPKEHETNVVRYVSAGVVMNLDSAKAIHQWLGQHIEQFEQENKTEKGEE